MTKAPERIKLRNAGCHETEGRQIWTNVGMGYEKVEYIRADLHAELIRAAYELAEAVEQERNMACQDFGMQLKASEVVGAALTAYQQAKEKLDADV